MITSYGHCTSNENRREEVEITYSRTLWQWLFKKPATTKRYEMFYGNWFDKDKRTRASVEEHFLADRIREQIRYETSR